MGSDFAYLIPGLSLGKTIFVHFLVPGDMPLLPSYKPVKNIIMYTVALGNQAKSNNKDLKRMLFGVQVCWEL